MLVKSQHFNKNIIKNKLLVNKTNMVHNLFGKFICILYMFRATVCPLSGEITVSMRRLVFVTVSMTVWYAGWDFIPWTHSCLKHVENTTNI
jgi:hypothetical protein